MGSLTGMILLASWWEKGIFSAQKGKLWPEGLLPQTPPRPAFFLVTLRLRLAAASWLPGQLSPPSAMPAWSVNNTWHGSFPRHQSIERLSPLYPHAAGLMSILQLRKLRCVRVPDSALQQACDVALWVCRALGSVFQWQRTGLPGKGRI